MVKPSEYFVKTFGWKSDSKTNGKFTFTRKDVRFSLLTDRLLRVEVDKDLKFTDEPTQTVICRNFAEPVFKIIDDGDVVIIITTKTNQTNQK